jgi:hypothetical protein
VITTQSLAATYDVTQTPTGFNSGQGKSYSVRVTNVGSQLWTMAGPNPVHLGIHFAAHGGGFGTGAGNSGYGIGNGWFTDGRVNLTSDVPSGSSLVLNIWVVAPTNSGNQVLEYEMVKEGVSWFPQFSDVNVSVAAPDWSAAYAVSATPTSWSASQGKSYSVTVTNTGGQLWSMGGPNPVHLGIHFAAQGGGYGTGVGNSGNGIGNGWYTDGRVNLQNDVPAGASVTLSVWVVAPANTGNEVLEYQMVKEGVTWFPEFSDVNVTVT